LFLLYFLWRFMRTMVIGVLTMAATLAGAADGLVEIKSGYSLTETITRFENAAKERKPNIFLRIDHAASAQKVGRTLRPTELLIFGNPQGGTPLMECAQSAGIDLPLKALAWEDASGQVQLGYNDPHHLAARHGSKDCPAAAALRKALDGLAAAAVTK
jgi:uncharacterized protein (DUF302 family)